MKQLVLIICLLLPWSVSGQVYKYVDKDGIINYTTERPKNQQFKTLNFPCYASNPDCRKVDWHNVRLNASAYSAFITVAAETHEVDPALVRAIIHAESAFKADAQSPKGAQGLMQLMPANQPLYGVTDPYEPEQNIKAGTQHLSELLEEFEGDIALAVAAYNAGAGAVRKYSGVPPYAETREYVRRVRILHDRYRNES